MSKTRSSALYSTDPRLGVHAFCQDFIDKIEQCYPLDPNGNMILNELPVTNRVGTPYRCGDSYQYICMPVHVSMLWNQLLS